ncbi:hypothetical protein EHQ16_17570 [Leptospira kanakyensis]|uniref:Uncharacterized protein n=1 Tax=Leptospira kanakyensis TaxID=2484968 RepID=A0A6N4QL62_9LEPT|nr:hypothetical protein [Leptospira kanakyensis]TGK53855.1 hypothetical protein EHQ11_05880 [Leptospira kanakyensis]TGK57650.1 hypothetical protein EHQ16_17570 [Leptospira kanakyensis]TGK73360.1 hypothetical protein EHQ18_05955 [Leptospira kanakyensis]
MFTIKKHLFLIVVIYCIFSKCQPEYANSPELCLVANAQLESALAKDLDDFNNGRMNQEQYERAKRNRETGALGLCLISLIKRKQNSNF